MEGTRLQIRLLSPACNRLLFFPLLFYSITCYGIPVGLGAINIYTKSVQSVYISQEINFWALSALFMQVLQPVICGT